MSQRVPFLFKWGQGFIPTQPRAGGLDGSIYSGENVWIWGAGLIESAKGTSSAGPSGGANPLMNIENTHGGVTGGGTIVRAFGTTWAAGTGTVFKGGVSIGTVAGDLRLLVGGTLVTAGIAQPSAPVISNSGAAGKNNGSYSICLTAIRSLTGHESTRSLPSNTVSVSSKKIRVTFPAAPSGADRWGVYCSFQNFGATGPWFRLTDVATGPATADFEWFNGELGVEAPIDHDPPPACTHCFSSNSTMVAAGSFGGDGLSPSVPGVPEGFPPDFTVFIPGGGPITGCKGTGFEGSVLISTSYSLNAAIGTNNADVSPLLVRQIWPTTGFATGSAWATLEGEVYGFSGQRGAVRTQGEGPPDTSFAWAVQKFFADNGYTASNTVVGYDPKTDSVIFASGTKALPFSRSRGWWHCPMTLPGTAITSATVGGRLLIDTGGGALQEFEGGSGTAWFVIPAFTDFGQPEYNHTLVRARSSSNVTYTLDVLADEDIVTSHSGALSMIAPHSDWQHLNIRNKKTISFKASGTGAVHTVNQVEMEAIPHMVTR